MFILYSNNACLKSIHHSLASSVTKILNQKFLLVDKLKLRTLLFFIFKLFILEMLFQVKDVPDFNHRNMLGTIFIKTQQISILSDQENDLITLILGSFPHSYLSWLPTSQICYYVHVPCIYFLHVCDDKDQIG